MAEPVGSLLGFKIVTYGTRGGLDVPRRWALPGGLTVQTADRTAVLDARLRPFTLDSIVTLCAQLSTARLFHDPETRNALQQRGWDPDVIFLPFGLRRVLHAALKRRELPDQATRHMTLPDMKGAYDAALDVVPEVDATASAEVDGVMSMALRMLQSQYVDQLGHTQFYRETYLAARTIKHAREAGVDVDAAYMRAYGCTFNDLTFVTFATLSAAAANVHAQFNPREMNAAGAIPNLTQQVIDAVWSLIGIDYAEFQERANAPEVNVAGYETYSLSPTVKWPLVIRSDGNAVAPSAVDLLHRGPRGFHFDSSAALAGDPDGLARFRTAGAQCLRRMSASRCGQQSVLRR